jgi:tRNA pseudouridine38-40 synthase
LCAELTQSLLVQKRRVCVYFGYCGIGYSGLQINPGVKTIEGDIFDSFCSLGAVSQDNAVNPTKVGLQRAARTDRGVHAAGNLMSLKLILEPPGVANQDELILKINEKLPEYIRIWGITRVQNSFDARQSCDSRMYEYLLPTYVFLPPKPGTAMYDMLKKMKESGSGSSDDAAADTDSSKPLQSNSGEEVPSWDSILDHPFWKTQGTRKTFTEDLIEKKKWRMPADMLSRIRKIFEQFSGSHNFHNFTVQKEFRDRSAHRFMKKLTVSEPMLINDTEWISIKLHGQSFMLHQIVSPS